MAAVILKGTVATTNNYPEITNEHALRGHYADLGNCTDCGNTLQISRSAIFGSRQVRETCPCQRLNRAEEEEEEVSLVTLDCEIQHYSAPIEEEELTAEQVIIWQQNGLKLRKLSSPVSVRGNIAIGDFEGYLHILDSIDGSFLARKKISKNPILEIVSKSDKLVVIDESGKLFFLSVQ